VQNEPKVQSWQYSLANSLYRRAGAISEHTRDSHEAKLSDYREASALVRELQKGSDRKETKEILINSLVGISLNALFVRQDEEALAAAEEALELAPGDMRIMLNKAHALMYLERIDEALAIYEKHKGKALLSETWEKSIVEHFAELKAAGRAHPVMDRVIDEMDIESTRATKLRAK
jgi:tetratricopeptide (TPR) repeat protein